MGTGKMNAGTLLRDFTNHVISMVEGGFSGGGFPLSERTSSIFREIGAW